eukprot:gene8517-9215_t
MFSTVITRFSARQSNKIATRQYKSSSKAQGNVLEADSSNTLNKYFHKSNLLLAVLTPAAFLVPSTFVQPIDVTLGLILPFHSHVAMNYVITDYVPKSSRPLARGLLLAATLIGTAGLLKLNLTGPGLTATVLNLWKQEKKEKK